MEKWKVDSETSVIKNGIGEVFKRVYELPNGNKIDSHVTISKDVAVLVGMIDGNVIMVKQCRPLAFAADSITLEFPGGHIEKGEDPMTAAIREFEEETGYCLNSRAVEDNNVQCLGVFAANPNTTNQKLYVYYTDDISPKVNEQSLDENEKINVVLIHRIELRQMFNFGKIEHMYAACAYMAFERHFTSLVESVKKYINDGLKSTHN